MIYKIWKLPTSNPSKFRGFGEHEVHLRDYVKVYSGEIEAKENVYEILEKIYVCLNTNHPVDYHSSSLSVSDVVELVTLVENRIHTDFYYVDDIGFKKLDWEDADTKDRLEGSYDRNHDVYGEFDYRCRQKI